MNGSRGLLICYPFFDDSQDKVCFLGSDHLVQRNNNEINNNERYCNLLLVKFDSAEVANAIELVLSV